MPDHASPHSGDRVSASFRLEWPEGHLNRHHVRGITRQHELPGLRLVAGRVDGDDVGRVAGRTAIREDLRERVNRPES